MGLLYFYSGIDTEKEPLSLSLTFVLKSSKVKNQISHTYNRYMIGLRFTQRPAIFAVGNEETN